MGEEPDFTVSRPGGSLGIELTQLLQESPPEESPIQAQESLRARVLASARELYKASDPSVIVSILFNPVYPVAKSRVQRLAEAAIEIALRNMPPSGAYSEEPEERYPLNGSYFPREFDRIAVYRGVGLTQTSWSAPGSTWIQTFGCDQLQAVLDKKARRCWAYRERCKELWLLIVADGERLATTIAIEEQIVGHEFRSDSTGSFFYKTCGRFMSLLLRRARPVRRSGAVRDLLRRIRVLTPSLVKEQNKFERQPRVQKLG